MNLTHALVPSWCNCLAFVSARRFGQLWQVGCPSIHGLRLECPGQLTPEVFVGSYRVEQRRLKHRGRHFHFVSYQGRPANTRRGESALADMWFLMSEGKRYAAIPQVRGQDIAELDRALLAWVDEHVFAQAAELVEQPHTD